MDDPLKKLTESPEWLKQFERANSTFDALRKLEQSSAMSEIRKRVEAMRSFEPPKLPELPSYEPVRIPMPPTFEETNRFQSAGVLLRRLAEAMSRRLLNAAG